MRLAPNAALANQRRTCAFAAAFAALLLAAAPARGVEPSFLYTLADATGPERSSWVRLAHDPQAHETFVLDPSEGIVHVFSRSGIETYSFGDDAELGSAVDLAVLDGGELVLLTWIRGSPALLRCNFRGEPVGRIEPRGLPAAFAGFVPDRIRFAGGNLYLASSQAMKVVAIAPDGTFVRSYDASAVAAGRKARDAGFTGFAVDAGGDVLFTVAPLFQAFVLGPDGELKSFGVRGSSPGKFNVVGGIAADAAGYVYVTDVLRSVVMVFSPSFDFLGEFGYRGDRPENLVAPRDLVVGDGQVFVTQSAARGVSVFRVDAPRLAAGS